VQRDGIVHLHLHGRQQRLHVRGGEPLVGERVGRHLAVEQGDERRVLHAELAVEARARLRAVEVLETREEDFDALDLLAPDAVRFAQLQRLRSEGAEAVGGTPAQFKAFLASELAKWTSVAREAGDTARLRLRRARLPA
jgi:hypothetical protein